MVEVTRLNGQIMVVNSDLIEIIEAKPDTIVSLTTGKKLLIRESVTELVQRLFDYRRALVQLPDILEVQGESVSFSKAV